MTGSVLCVGPRTPDRATIETALAAAGLSSLWVESRRQALEALSQRAFPLCLIDLIGNGDAARTAKAIRAGYPRALLIGIADTSRHGDVAEAMRGGLFDVLTRPIAARDVDAILANARELLDSDAVPPSTSASSTRAIPLELAGSSPLIQRVNELIQSAADARCSVIVVAEDGIDAAAAAGEIHRRSRRAAAPLVTVSCAGTEPGSIERDLFGGPSNGQARNVHITRVTQTSAAVRAAGGTIVLLNVGELSASLQERLARLARDGEMMVAGADRPVRFEARLVATCSPGIDEEVEDGRFRLDLCRRLSTIRLDLPPLRQRVDDIPFLARAVATEACASRGIAAKRLTQAALTLLAALPWRGNMSELRIVIEKVVLGEPGDVITLESVLRHVRLDGSAGPTAPAGTLAEARTRFEREYIAAVLQHHRWRMTDAAKALGIQRPNLYRKARQLGIPRARPRSRA